MSILNNSEISDRERLILDAAIKIFAEKGYDKSTTKEIAEIAGIAEGTIFRYYKTKNNILEGVLTLLISTISKNVVFKSIEKLLKDNEGKTPEELIKLIIKDRIELVEQVFPLMKIVVMQAFTSEAIKKAFYDNVMVKAFELFESVFEEMKQKNMIRKDLSNENIFRSIVGNIIVLILPRVMLADIEEPKDLDTEIDSVIEIIMNGIKVK